VNPQSHRWVGAQRPLRRALALALALALPLAAAPGLASAQPKKRRSAQRAEAPKGKASARESERKGGKKREKVFDFTGFELAGSVRMPQLLYFLDRAEQELERASLERRSFVPEMLKSLEEEDL